MQCSSKLMLSVWVFWGKEGCFKTGSASGIVNKLKGQHQQGKVLKLQVRGVGESESLVLNTFMMYM